ncbi:MAG: hypothetical protein H7A40_05440 [Chlamydiales bacterium]|nr:hypothetical protein [Chlamydiales bacterium]
MGHLQIDRSAYEMMVNSCRGAQKTLAEYGIIGEVSFFHHANKPVVIQFDDEKMDIIHIGRPGDSVSIETVTKQIVLKVLHHKVAVAEGVTIIGDGSKYDLRNVGVKMTDVDGLLCIDGVPIIHKDALIIGAKMLRTDTVHRVHKLAGDILIIYNEELGVNEKTPLYVDMRRKVHSEGYDCYRSSRLLNEFEDITQETWTSVAALVKSIGDYDLLANLSASNLDEQISEYKERLELIEKAALSG